MLLGLWPVIALSRYLAGKAARGSTDAWLQRRKAGRTIPLEKVAGRIGHDGIRNAHPGHRRGGRRSGLRIAARWRHPFTAGTRPSPPVRPDARRRPQRRIRDGAITLGRTRALAATGSSRCSRAIPSSTIHTTLSPLIGNSSGRSPSSLDSRTSTHGGSHRLGGRGDACRNRRRVAGHRCRPPSVGATLGVSPMSAGFGCRRCQRASEVQSPGGSPTRAGAAITWG